MLQVTCSTSNRYIYIYENVDIVKMGEPKSNTTIIYFDSFTVKNLRTTSLIITILEDVMSFMIEYRTWDNHSQ